MRLFYNAEILATVGDTDLYVPKSILPKKLQEMVHNNAGNLADTLKHDIRIEAGLMLNDEDLFTAMRALQGNLPEDSDTEEGSMLNKGILNSLLDLFYDCCKSHVYVHPFVVRNAVTDEVLGAGVSPYVVDPYNVYVLKNIGMITKCILQRVDVSDRVVCQIYDSDRSIYLPGYTVTILLVKKEVWEKAVKE